MPFKTPATPNVAPATKGLKSSNDTHSEVDSRVEVPYTSYESQTGKPYTVDHYGLSDYWRDNEGGFGEEIATIESYLRHKIESGDIADSQSAIKEELKKIEKLTNMNKEERLAVKLGSLSAYAKFLMETDKIKYNARKYRT